MASKKIVAFCHLSSQLIIIAKYEAFVLTFFAFDIHNGVWSQELERQRFDDNFRPESLRFVAISATICVIFVFSSVDTSFKAFRVHSETPSTLSIFSIIFAVPPTTTIVDIIYNQLIRSFLCFTGKDILISEVVTDDQFEEMTIMTIKWKDRPLIVTTDAGPLKNFWNMESERFYRCCINSSVSTSTTLLVETKAISSPLSSYSWITINFEENKSVFSWRQPMMSSDTACLLFCLHADQKEYAILAADTNLALCDSSGILYLFDIGVSFPIISLSITNITTSKVESVCGSTHGLFKSVCFDINSKSLLKVADFNDLSKSSFAGCLNLIEDINIICNQRINNCHQFVVLMGSQSCGYSLIFSQDTMQLVSSSTLSNMYYDLAMTGTVVNCIHSHTHHSHSIITCQTMTNSLVLQQLKFCLPFIHEATIDLDISLAVDSKNDLTLTFAGTMIADIHRVYLTSLHSLISSLLQWNTATNEVVLMPTNNEQRGLFVTFFQLNITVIIEVFEFAIVVIDMSMNRELWSLSLSEMVLKCNYNSSNKDKISKIDHASYLNNHLNIYCGTASISCKLSSPQCVIQYLNMTVSVLEVACTASLSTEQYEIEVISSWDSNDCLIRVYDRKSQQVIEQNWKMLELKSLIRNLFLHSVGSHSTLLIAADVDGNLQLALITYAAEILTIDNVVSNDLCLDSSVKQISFLSSHQKDSPYFTMKFAISTDKLSYLLQFYLSHVGISQSLVRLELSSMNYQSAVIVSSLSPSNIHEKVKILLLPGPCFDVAIIPTATWNSQDGSIIIGSIDMSQTQRMVVTGCTSLLERHSSSYFDQISRLLYTITWNESNDQVLTVYAQQNLRIIKQLPLLPASLPFLVACPKAVAFYVTSNPTHSLMNGDNMLKMQTPLCFFFYDLAATSDISSPYESVVIVFYTLWDQSSDCFTVISNMTWKVSANLYQQPPIVSDIGSRHILILTADGEMSVIGWMMAVEQQEGGLELQRLCSTQSKMITNKKNSKKILVKIEGDFCLISIPEHGFELYRLFDDGGRDLVHCCLELLWTQVDSSISNNVFLLQWFDSTSEEWCLKVLGIVQGRSVSIYSLIIDNEERVCFEPQTRQALFSLTSDHHLSCKTCIKIDLRPIVDFNAWKEETRLEDILQQCDILFA